MTAICRSTVSNVGSKDLYVEVRNTDNPSPPYLLIPADLKSEVATWLWLSLSLYCAIVLELYIDVCWEILYAGLCTTAQDLQEPWSEKGKLSSSLRD